MQKVDFAERLEEANVKYWGKDAFARKIELQRSQLMSNSVALTAFEGQPGPFDSQTVQQAVAGSKNRLNCWRLAEMSKICNAEKLVEFGTNLGISSAYLALGAPRSARLLTGDISGIRIGIARRMHSDLEICNVNYSIGDFKLALIPILPSAIDLCFIDGDHTYSGTLQYFEAVVPQMRRGALIIFDDITWSKGMTAAWNEIKGAKTAVRHYEIDGVGYLQVDSTAKR